MSIKKYFFAPLASGRGAMRRAAMLLLVMMLTTATAWAQTTITPTTPSQDGGYYLIGSAAELYGFAQLVNNGNATANAKLTADIVVNENVLDANGEANTGDFVQWTPIGNNYFEDKVYSGTFDGQRHTISGLYVSGNGWNVGFVGRVSGTAVVKNLGIVDSYFNSSNNFLGSIVGGVAEKSSVTIANVYSTSTVKGENYIGGLVGGDGSGSVTIINSYFAGKTSATFQSGKYNTHHDDLVSGEFVGPNSGTLTVVNTFVLGTSNHGTSVTAAQLSDGTVAAALHYYQDALADGSMFGLSGGKTNFSGTIDGVSVTTANITLHTFDGDATAYSSKYIVGNTTPLPVKVVRDGYTFFGWYDNANLEGDAVTQISSSATGDKEYWAKFERSHSVTFELNGGTIQSGAIDHYIEGETTVLPAYVTKDGASFEGWYTTEDFTGSRYYSIPATATEDMTFYAKWGAEKTTFYLGQGRPEPVSILYEGENMVWLDETTMESYAISDNNGNLWGSDSGINVPYTGGESTFGNNASEFSVAQSGFYVFTLTDKGDGNWFVSVLKSMLNCDVASIPTQVYTGSAIEPDVTVKDGETTLTLGTDYEVAYSNNVNAGTATVTITGKGNYSGETAATFTIVNPVTTSYVDASGTLHDGVEAVPLDNTMTTLPAGTYVVNSDVAYTGTVTLSGDVTLILADGKTMSVTNTGTGNEDFAIYGDSGSLYIYGQSQGTGALTATANSSVAIKVDDYITIDGGIVNATSTGDVGIYGIDGVTINGGTVNAKGIYSVGDITINGGKVTATATSNSGICSYSGTIILGLRNATDYITAESYSGAVKIADGKTLVDENGTIWSGTLSNDDLQNSLLNKTLRPVMGVVLTKDGSGNISAEFDGTSLETMSIPVDITVNSVTLNRTFTYNKCATLMLPFSLGDGQSLNGGTLYKFDGVNNGEGDWVATLSEFTSPLKANTPYLIEPNGHMTYDKITFDLKGGTVTLNTTTAGEDSNEKDDLWDFIGTYSYIKWTSDTGDQDYSAEREAEIGKVYGFAAVEKTGIQVGDFVRVASGAKIRPMCAYLKWKGSIPNNARALTRGAANDDTELPQRITVKLVSASGETTAIGTLDTTTGEVSFDSEAWYTLDGVRLSGKPTKKGLYINNGKKIVIR